MELKLFKIKMAVEGEIHSIVQMLMPENSFRSFCTNNEVFDIRRHKVIKRRHKLFQLYAGDIDINSLIIINKN